MSSVSYYGPRDPVLAMRELLSSPPPAISIDVETVSIKERMPLGFGIGISPTEAFYFQMYPEPAPGVEKLIPLLSNPNIIKVAHAWLVQGLEGHSRKQKTLGGLIY